MDGQIAVICPQCKKEIVKTIKHYEKIYLGKAPWEVDGLIVRVHVRQHFWDYDRWESDINKGQVAEEEVVEGMEARVQPDEQDDEQAPQHCGHLHAQEQGEEQALLLW